jgi:hypothetical protein
MMYAPNAQSGGVGLSEGGWALNRAYEERKRRHREASGRSFEQLKSQQAKEKLDELDHREQSIKKELRGYGSPMLQKWRGKN